MLKDQSVIVLFDRVCTVCRVLADIIADDAPSHWHFKAWQDYSIPTTAPSSWHEIIPSELRVVTGDQYLEGEKAWQYLIEHNPRLHRYQLLAAKLGLSPPKSARWLQAMGHGIRKLCVSCLYFRR